VTKVCGHAPIRSVVRDRENTTGSHLSLEIASVALAFFVLSAYAAGPQFEVVSVKPNISASDQVDFAAPVGGRFKATNVSVRMLIMRAYKVKNFEVSGGPSWIGSDRYDIAATSSDINNDEAQFKLMLQALLADRFKLAVHRETRQMPVYALLPAKDGLKLPEAMGNCVEHGTPPPSTPFFLCGGFMMDGSHLEGRRISMAQFAGALSNMLGRPVIDQTGYGRAFDVRLEFAPESIAALGGGGFGAPTLPSDAPDSSTPTIFTAIQQQLGLPLESQKGPAGILVIDHAEKPSAN